jgi:hypothetical protein
MEKLHITRKYFFINTYEIRSLRLYRGVCSVKLQLKDLTYSLVVDIYVFVWKTHERT